MGSLYFSRKILSKKRSSKLKFVLLPEKWTLHWIFDVIYNCSEICALCCCLYNNICCLYCLYAKSDFVFRFNHIITKTTLIFVSFELFAQLLYLFRTQWVFNELLTNYWLYCLTYVSYEYFVQTNRNFIYE